MAKGAGESASHLGNARLERRTLTLTGPKLGGMSPRRAEATLPRTTAARRARFPRTSLLPRGCDDSIAHETVDLAIRHATLSEDLA